MPESHHTALTGIIINVRTSTVTVRRDLQKWGDPSRNPLRLSLTGTNRGLLGYSIGVCEITGSGRTGSSDVTGTCRSRSLAELVASDGGASRAIAYGWSTFVDELILEPAGRKLRTRFSLYSGRYRRGV
jgi:hypothetical protein